MKTIYWKLNGDLFPLKSGEIKTIEMWAEHFRVDKGFLELLKKDKTKIELNGYHVYLERMDNNLYQKIYSRLFEEKRDAYQIVITSDSFLKEQAETISKKIQPILDEYNGTI